MFETRVSNVSMIDEAIYRDTKLFHTKDKMTDRRKTISKSLIFSYVIFSSI